MIFLALKTEDGRITGKIAFYCRMLGISRQGFYKYLANKNRPWKYQDLADVMKEIISEDECNDTYGRIRMYQALLLKRKRQILRSPLNLAPLISGAYCNSQPECFLTMA